MTAASVWRAWGAVIIPVHRLVHSTDRQPTIAAPAAPQPASAALRA